MRLSWACCVVLLLAPIPRATAVTFIEVPNYRSAADSPFDLSGLGTTFFLEDFEDQVGLITEIPGALVGTQATWMGGPSALVRTPDTGAVAVEPQGHALYPVFEQWNFKSPQDSWTGLRLEFQQDVLGFLPTAVGFVRPFSNRLDADLTIDVFGRDGELLASLNRVFDEDRVTPFVGVLEPRGIQKVVITSHTLTPESSSSRHSARFSIDHVQYGLIVPEPSGVSLALMAIAGVYSQYTGMRRRGFP